MVNAFRGEVFVRRTDCNARRGATSLQTSRSSRIPSPRAAQERRIGNDPHRRHRPERAPRQSGLLLALAVALVAAAAAPSFRARTPRACWWPSSPCSPWSACWRFRHRLCCRFSSAFRAIGQERHYKDSSPTPVRKASGHRGRQPGDLRQRGHLAFSQGTRPDAHRRTAVFRPGSIAGRFTGWPRPREAFCAARRKSAFDAAAGEGRRLVQDQGQAAGTVRRQARHALGRLDVTRERERHENVFQELQHAIDHLDHAPAGFVRPARRSPT